jgi:UDP-N-acetyl-2-amino-2-deoxyglucuronate dehydrogenase
MLKFGLLGCGRIAIKHAELLGQGQIKGGELVAVCDIDILKAQKFSEQFKVPWFSNLHEMMKNTDLDVV